MSPFKPSPRNSERWLWLVPLAFAVGGVAMRSLLGRAPAAIAVDLAQPLPVATSWHAYGCAAFGILAATIALATAALVAALRNAPVPGRHDGPAVAGIAALALLAAGTWPLVFSSDVYAYAAYGALALDGRDPYVVVPPGLHGDFIDAARWQWSGVFPPCVYGPLFVALAREGVAILRPAGVAATLAAFRLAAAGAFLAAIVLFDASLRAISAAPRATAVRAFGLNPVALWTVAEGHNDAFLVLAVLAGAALALRGARFTGALIVGLSPLLKAPGILFAALAGAAAAAFRRPGTGPVVAGLCLATVAAAALTIPPLLPALAAVGTHGRYTPQVSAQGLLGPVPALALASFAALAALLTLRARRRAGFAWAGIAVLLALPNPYPWYAPWLVPLAVAAGPGPAGFALWAGTISAVVRYLPDAAGTLDPAAAHAAALVAALPLAWALAALPAKKAIAQP